MNDEIDPLRVHVVNVPAMPDRMGTRGRNTNFRTILSSAVASASIQALQILPQSGKRRRAVITFVGQSTDIAYLCGSSSDAQNGIGMVIMGLQVIPLTGTDEVWVSVPANVAQYSFGVAAEYED